MRLNIGRKTQDTRRKIWLGARRSLWWRPVYVGCWVSLYLVSCILYPRCAEAARAEIRASGTVASFGTYSFSGPLLFQITQPGDLEIGHIQVDGVHNGEYPWVMRIYTDNASFVGVGGALSPSSRAGLISSDGQYVVPLFVSCPNFGDEIWIPVPDRSDPAYQPYRPSDQVGVRAYSECIIMGIDPRNADWVAGDDRSLWTEDDNPLGDTTMATPFEIRVAARCGVEAVAGTYTGRVIIELVTAP